MAAVTTLGIIGGIAPPSTIDYYRLLVAGYRARHPDGASPSLLIDSIDSARFFTLLAADDRAGMVDLLLVELRRLAAAGVDLAIFASNSPHLVFDAVASNSPVPLISIVEETAKVAVAQGLTTVGLIGARYTMERGFYEAVFAPLGITVVVPEPDDRAYVHERYFTELVEGSFLETTRAGIAAVVDRMRAQHGIEAIILGGTELPLLFRDGPPLAVPALDTTAIHVAAAIARMLPE
jgi:aspartate racemase